MKQHLFRFQIIFIIKLQLYDKLSDDELVDRINELIRKEEFLMKGLDNIGDQLDGMSNTDKMRALTRMMDKLDCMFQRQDLNRILRDKQGN